ncbi:MAG TPA: recombinase family protein [Acidimicrobiales bacterium]|jgi:DNA invertase Pin-like site-specific DNA recombinase
MTLPEKSHEGDASDEGQTDVMSTALRSSARVSKIARRDNEITAHEVGVVTKRAVLYLRVSTPSQVKTDYNPEGISLPAQRESCELKGATLGAEIVREFVEPGRSATNIANRPVFQEMMAWIKTQKDIDYIIVYQFNRIFRNSIDAVITKRDLSKYGTRVVPTIMDLGEGPESDMVEIIMHAVGEYQSKANGADIAYKMGAKARNGGTLGRARIGYMNARDLSEGRNIGIVKFDPERAPFMKTAFELYATGDHSLESLAAELTARGLKTRPGRYPSGPVSTSKLNQLLRDPYYIGFVTYKGETYPGRHEPLISADLFDRVQDVLAERGGRGARQRRHHHYLKGSLWCGRCHDSGHDARVIFQWSNGHGGKYLYFFCLRRQQHHCDAPYIEGDALEAAVLDYYGSLRLPSEVIQGVRDLMQEMLAEEKAAAKLLHEQLAKEMMRLDTQEENLVDLVADGNLSSTKVKQRLSLIQRQRSTVQERLKGTVKELSAGVALVEDGLKLLEDPQGLYRRMDPGQRQLLNQAIFEKLYVDIAGVAKAVFNPPFDELVATRGGKSGSDDPRARKKTSKTQKRTLEGNGGKYSFTRTLTPVFFGEGSSKALMVDMNLLEPSWSLWKY